MIGWILIIASAVLIGRIASAEDRSPILWGSLTLLLCVVSVMFIPLPLLNIGIGLVLGYLAMFTAKALQQ